ncbi:MAG: hypothetical protein LBV72_17000 [Tannerella sp.]|jgi:hypothetical protein|nr:hypothetical protein [Tannerella sp.]
MSVKSYFLAVSICCVLPFMAQGVDLEPVDEPKPPVRAQARSISPVVIETDCSMITLYFTRDFGEVFVILQPAAKKINYFYSVDTSIQDQAGFNVPAGSYILTVTDTAGNIIQQESIIIP